MCQLCSTAKGGERVCSVQFGDTFDTNEFGLLFVHRSYTKLKSEIHVSPDEHRMTPRLPSRSLSFSLSLSLTHTHTHTRSHTPSLSIARTHTHTLSIGRAAGMCFLRHNQPAACRYLPHSLNSLTKNSNVLSALVTRFD